MSETLTSTASGTYAIDASHSHVGFVARHAMVTKVRGSFNELEGTGHFDADDPTSSQIDVTIDTASVDTRSADRDGHLRGADFFDVEQYPTIRFVSTDIAEVGNESYEVTGDLTIKDVTKPVTFSVTLGGVAVDPFGNTRLGLEGHATVNRKDWGLTWNAALETGGVLVSEKIQLELEISAVKSDA